MTEPLLTPATTQPDLLPGARTSFFAELESTGEFTGQRLFDQRPDTYKAIVVLLAQKLGVIKIGKALGVSPNTVMAVRDREQPSIDIAREHLARVAHAGATLASEGILDTLNEILQRRHCLGVKDLKELAVVYGILVQNGQLLAGLPTSRVEITDFRRPDHDDFNAYLANLPQAKAEVIHLEGEKSAQKEPARGEKESGSKAGSEGGTAAQAGGPADEESEG